MSCPPLSRFAAWLEHTGMTEAEKADCLLRARQGFDQGAQLLMLGGPRTEERFLLRVLGAKRARSRGPWQLGSWRFWSCLAGQNRREFLKCFLNRDGSSNKKRLVILFAASGRGGRLRAMQVWRRACAGDEALMGEIPVLLIQTSRSKRSRAAWVPPPGKQRMVFAAGGSGLPGAAGAGVHSDRQRQGKALVSADQKSERIAQKRGCMPAGCIRAFCCTSEYTSRGHMCVHMKA